MRARLRGMWLAAALFASLARTSSACTTLVVGKAATKDGAVLLTHSDDGESGFDARLCAVAAKDHAPNSSRPVYYDKEDYPRFIGHERGPCYTPAPGEKPFEPIGSIPQVAHTYAYFEATYGLVNEHGLGMGESTCSGVFGAAAAGHGGKALLSIDSLTRIALEREKSAREAVKLMGGLAEEYGFYGAGSFEGTAESLMVGDAEEAFIFHILPDPNGTSAIWVAQRVPDDHVGVVANMFVIREIDFNDTKNFLFSESVRTVATEQGWWKPGQGPFDFTRMYSDGEYEHKFYSGRRVWGAYRRFGLEFQDSYADLRYEAVYPVTAKPPSANVSVHDLFSIHRDYYEGTKYDMTKGLAAGPWGDPDRWTTTAPKGMKGHWERSIGLFRTTSTHVVDTRRGAQGAILWFAPHATASSVFIPLAAKATEVPVAYTVGDPDKINRGSAYWVNRIVFNAAKIKYKYAMADVRSVQAQLEKEGDRLVRELFANSSEASPECLNKAYAKHAEAVVSQFRDLPDTLIAKYADGWLSDGEPMGYPQWWLRAVGYEQGPPDAPPESLVIFNKRVQAQERVLVSCSDAQVERCVGGCPSGGFAACAAACTRACPRQPEAVV